jgi:hypothetical protein
MLTIVLNFFPTERRTLQMFVLFVCGYTFVPTTCFAGVIYLFPILFKRFFDEKQWTRGKYFILTIIINTVIGIATSTYNYILEVFFFHSDIPYFVILRHNLIISFLIGTIASMLVYFWLKNRGLHSDLQEKEEQNRKLSFRMRQEGIVSEEKMVTLSGDRKDTLTLFPHELFYLESQGNYIHVYYKTNEQIQFLSCT